MDNLYRVPVSAYVKKYLVRKFFVGKKGPYKIEEDTLLGKQFMANIIDGRRHDFIDTHLQLSSFIEVALSQDMIARSPKQSKLRSLNFFFDKIFKEGLIDWILSAQYYHVRPYAATRDFLDFYQIDNAEYSHDAAYKLWTRWKRMHEEKAEKKVSHRRPKSESATSVALTGIILPPPIDFNHVRPAA